MDRLQITLTDPIQAHAALTKQVWPYIKSATIAGHRLHLEVRPDTRSLEQNRLMWSILHDISRHIEWYGQRLSPEDWKHLFTAALKKQRAVPGIDGGVVMLGQYTSRMTKAEMAEMIDFMTAFAVEKGVPLAQQAECV